MSGIFPTLDDLDIREKEKSPKFYQPSLLQGQSISVYKALLVCHVQVVPRRKLKPREGQTTTPGHTGEWSGEARPSLLPCSQFTLSAFLVSRACWATL